MRRKNGGRPRRSRRVRLAVAFLAVAVFGIAGSASGHPYLEASAPAPGGALPAGATVLVLRFSETVDDAHAWTELIAPNGTTMPTRATFPSQRSDEMRIDVEPLMPGTHVLRWRSFGIDGHGTSGHFEFVVGQEERDADRAAAAGTPTASGGVAALEAVGRFLLMVGLLVALGVPVFLTEAAGPVTITRRIPAATAIAAAGGVLGGAILLGVLAVELGGGLGDAVGSIAGLLLAGKTLLVAAAGLLGLWAWRLEGAPRRRALLAGALPATVGLVLHSIGGHGLLAAVDREAAAGHVAMTLHLVAAATWTGGLLGLVLVAPGRDRTEIARLIRRFTPLALASAVVVVATGVYQAYIHLPTVQDMESTYGAFLVVKTVLFGVLLGFGAYYAFRLRQRLVAGGAEAGVFRRSVRWDATVMACLLLAAGGLAAAPVPSVPTVADPGLLATQQREVRIGDYLVVVQPLDEPVVPDAPVSLRIHVTSQTSRGTDDLGVSVAYGPSGNDTTTATAQAGRVEADVWRADDVTFPHAGWWTVRIALESPVDAADGAVRVRVVDVGPVTSPDG